MRAWRAGSGSLPMPNLMRSLPAGHYNHRMGQVDAFDTVIKIIDRKIDALHNDLHAPAVVALLEMRVEVGRLRQMVGGDPW